MADLSSYSFTGRLGADAKVNVTPNGKTVMELSVAVATGFGDYKKTQWIKVRQWGERVNNVAPIFKKGALVGGSGEPSIESWTAKDGTVNCNLCVTCMSVNLIVGAKTDNQGSAGSDNEHAGDEAESIAF